MLEQNVKVTYSADHEFELATMVVQSASQYKSTIYIKMGNKRVNAKSIMGMMTLGLDNGESITVIAEGNDEEAAAANIESYLTGQQ